MPDYLIAILMLFPSAIMGLGVWQIQRMITKSEKKRNEQDQCREEYQLIMLQYTQASVKLGKASARYIINGKTDISDVTKALDYTSKVEAEQEKWLQKQGVKAVR